MKKKKKKHVSDFSALAINDMKTTNEHKAVLFA